MIIPLDWIALWITILGTVASVAGVGYAWTQGIRLHRLRRSTNADVWLSIRTTTSILDQLNRSPARTQDPDVVMAYGKAIELSRQLINQAVKAERRFDETTIAKWRAVGKLQGNWQEDQARQFFATKEIRSRLS